MCVLCCVVVFVFECNIIFYAILIALLALNA